MSGGGNLYNWFIGGISNNNHQYTSSSWYKKWHNGNSKIQIWRPRNRKMRMRVARYADWRFWSSHHKTRKNRHITYKITMNINSISPNYCSKLVWQAFKYGSGKYHALISKHGPWILPNGLISKFRHSYKPYKIGVF